MPGLEQLSLIEENDPDNSVEFYFDFDNSLSLFHIHKEMSSLIDKLVPRIAYDKLVILPKGVNFIEKPERYSIYLFQEKEGEYNEILAKWIDVNAVRQTREFYAGPFEYLLSATEEKVFSLADKPMAIHTARMLCGFPPKDKEISLQEAIELKEAIKNNLDVENYKTKEKINAWDYLNKKEVAIAGKKYPVLKLAEEIESHWYGILTVLLRQGFPISIATFGEFPETIKLILKEVIGLEDSIHIEWGGGKTKVQKIQHSRALAAQMILSKALPEGLENKLIYLTLTNGEVTAHWLGRDKIQRSQILCVESDDVKLLQTLPDNTLINQKTNRELLLKIAPLCDCIKSLEGVVYADDNDEEFKLIEELGGVTIHLNGGLKNAQILTEALPAKIKEAREGKLAIQKVEETIEVTKDFFDWLDGELLALIDSFGENAKSYGLL